AAETVRRAQAERFGLITTNSLTMIFNRRVIEAHQTATPPLSLAYAVPDHPWVDSADGAAVRIAMSVGVRGTAEGKLQTVTQEREAESGEVAVELLTRQGVIHADLKVGANVAGAKRLQANDRLSNRGVIPHGAGFIVTPDEARSLGLGTVPGLDQHIRPYRNGRDLTSTPRGVLVIDLFGLQADDVRQRFPAVYQWLLERVKPERDENNRQRVRELWWLFAEARVVMRRSLQGLPRYIVTGQVAKHRVFQWLDTAILPDDKLIAVASAEALHLGVLSSAVHAAWALAAGGLLEDRPVYSKSTCFDPFPFPDLDPSGALAQRIRTLAEHIDAHRKAQLAAHPDATLTATYNVLEKLRSGEALSAKEKVVHEHGLVGVLKSLHDELDAAVLQAYGWADLTLPADTDALLLRLVELNARRAAEEAAGTVRWLRPEFQQAGQGEQAAIDTSAEDQGEGEAAEATSAKPAQAAQMPVVQRPWPTGLTEQIKAVAEVLTSAGRSLDLEGLAGHFNGRGRWRDRLPTLLDTLVALGRARVVDGRWVGVGL
ncbi:MAG: type IIL restriction-modification enzyme MmeI, partial [Rubrivivax sp.]